MNGFAVWAQSPAGTLALTGCGLVVGMILGWLAGVPTGRRRESDDAWYRAQERKAAVWLKQMRADEEGIAAVREAGRRAWDLHERQALEVANDEPAIYPPGDPRHDWDPSCRQRGCPVHGNWDQPNGDPITTGEIAAITPRMDAFLEELFRVPYSADELWSGQ